jgi:hypothetical protein
VCVSRQERAIRTLGLCCCCCCKLFLQLIVTAPLFVARGDSVPHWPRKPVIIWHLVVLLSSRRAFFAWRYQSQSDWARQFAVWRESVAAASPIASAFKLFPANGHRQRRPPRSCPSGWRVPGSSQANVSVEGKPALWPGRMGRKAASESVLVDWRKSWVMSSICGGTTKDRFRFEVCRRDVRRQELSLSWTLEWRKWDPSLRKRGNNALSSENKNSKGT